MRARTAKQFSEFMNPEDLELFPNLRWLSSSAVNPRADHIVFYNQIWAKTDPFWMSNSPGQEWNCQCDVEETSDPVTNNTGIQTPVPPRGLEGNPAFTGEIFTDNASYIRNAEKEITIDDETSRIFKNLQALLNHNGKEWRADYYTDNAGFLFTSRERITQGSRNKQEKAKFDKEYNICKTLAIENNKIKYLKERPGKYDIIFNGQKADLKKLSSHNNIQKHAKHAIEKQGADIVIFEFLQITKDIIKELNIIKNKGIKAIYFESSKTSLYYINTKP